MLMTSKFIFFIFFIYKLDGSAALQSFLNLSLSLKAQSFLTLNKDKTEIVVFGNLLGN